MKKIPMLAIAALLACCGDPLLARTAASGRSAPSAATAGWSVRTSLGFDALCALNVLSGDPYYTSRYADETAMFAAPAYREARAAAARVKRRIKDQGMGIVSAVLVLVLSGGPDTSLDDVIRSIDDPDLLERRFRASPQWDADTWQQFVDVRLDVAAALKVMRRAGFERWWRGNVLPVTTRKAAELSGDLVDYDLAAEQRRLLGPTFKAEGQEVILLHFSKPHGIRVQGPRYLLNVGYPRQIVLRGGAHEGFHPPFDSSHPRVATALARLGSSAILRHVVADHDPSFGYNTIEGLIDEDCTQALEQIVAERLGFSDQPRDRWRADDGMHVLAAAIYQGMRDTAFVARGGVFQDWFVAMVEGGEFDDAKLRERAVGVLGEEAVKRWAP